MTYKEQDIMHETTTGHVVIKHARGRQPSYTVYIPKGTHIESDSAYALDADGLSIAIARCNYLSKRMIEKRAG